MENLVVSIPLLFLEQSTSSSGGFLELKCQAMKRNRPHQGSAYLCHLSFYLSFIEI